MQIAAFPASITPTNIKPFMLDVAVSTIEYEDLGMDFNLDSPAVSRGWELQYDFLSESEAATLDAHWETAQVADNAEFYFTDPYTDVVYNKVRYAPESGYGGKEHVKSWSPKRSVVLWQELA